MNPRIRRLVAGTLVCATLQAAAVPPAFAGLVGTEALGAAASRDRIAVALSRDDLRSRLEALGVNRGELQARVDALTDAEAAQLAQRLDALPAGGDGIVGAIVLVFLVLLITDIVGLTKVFPFTRSIR
jgi:hypothetical protein